MVVPFGGSSWWFSIGCHQDNGKLLHFEPAQCKIVFFLWFKPKMIHFVVTSVGCVKPDCLKSLSIVDIRCK